MDIMEVGNTAFAFREMSESEQAQALAGMNIALAFLQEELPFLHPDNLAAVAWIIATMMAQVMKTPVDQVSTLVADTAAAYGLAACRLLGLLDEGPELAVA